MLGSNELPSGAINCPVNVGLAIVKESGNNNALTYPAEFTFDSATPKTPCEGLAVPLAVPLEAVLFLKYCPAVVPTAARTSSTKPAIATIPTAPTAISSMATPTTPLTSKVVESVKESSAVEITTTAPLWAASAPLLIKSILKLRCSLRCVASALSGKASVWLTGSSDRPIDGRLNSLIVLYS